jgi:mRNA interferase RelE/StbE
MLGNKMYSVSYLESGVKIDIPTLPKKMGSMIKIAVEDRLMVDPVGFGKPLR